MADKIFLNTIFFGKNKFILAFRLADYESDIRFEKFKMSNQLWRIKSEKNLSKNNKN